MKENRMPRPTRIVAVALVASVLGVGGGAAYALSQPRPSADEPAGVSKVEGGPAPERLAPDWPTNASQQTYGSILEANSPEDAPDLVLVATREGEPGYVKRTELDAATGANVSSPKEAVAWQKTQTARAAKAASTFLDVYDQDGKTVIGKFEVQYSSIEP